MCLNTMHVNNFKKCVDNKILQWLLRRSFVRCLHVLQFGISHSHWTHPNVYWSYSQRSFHSKKIQRPVGGGRPLVNQDDIFKCNNWDNVEWNAEQERSAKEITENQWKSKLSQEKIDEYEKQAGTHWDTFYGIHQNRFFKDRNWLFTEFPELLPPPDEGCGNNIKPQETCVVNDSSFNLLEVGCGVGNTVFPVLKTNQNPNLKIYCCDFSPTAIEIVKGHPDYNQDRCNAFVCDISDEMSATPISDNSLDIVTIIFVLSSISPEKMQYVVNRLTRYLKPGGTILLRDYGRYDMAQLRFKQDELKQMFEKAGLVEKQNLIDRRLQVNRGKQLKMYRVWIQCKYVKPC
ncbi:tRNA N(3)-methylcytidine methyltransferase METTL2-like isoform X3 [Mytilus californianus]|uniref:tRNA N(3)-methylcytidine methyltransferase METTL2-like isoform X3 n=1 Tax=Mytilus californianus TaxID=6549 RepID=UPI0022487117|nr:tRNA N(3)-methylcytidine methyltransferase METTL2-like isoform X3 [Mytilus californianus]